jgi:hypothetical protein
MEVHRGKIQLFSGVWMSGLAQLTIEDDRRGLVVVHCENAPTVRALEGAFGNVIGEGHTVNPRGGHVGREVYYSVDAIGVLDGFTPVEEAPPEVVRRYEEAMP